MYRTIKATLSSGDYLKSKQSSKQKCEEATSVRMQMGLESWMAPWSGARKIVFCSWC